MSNAELNVLTVAALFVVIIPFLVVAGLWWKHRIERPGPASLMDSDPTDDDWPC
jgi:hypothetical protein